MVQPPTLFNPDNIQHRCRSFLSSSKKGMGEKHSKSKDVVRQSHEISNNLD